MEQLLDTLKKAYPQIVFKPGDEFCWSPGSKEVCYPAHSRKKTAHWSLLHETSHALLDHRAYGPDFELLKLEVMAWEKAKELANNLGISIDENHVQDCLDSYRDWIYARSICPQCGTKSLQQGDLRHYHCFNCHEVWQVTPSRFCRAYRATKRARTAPLPHFDAFLGI